MFLEGVAANSTDGSRLVMECRPCSSQQVESWSLIDHDFLCGAFGSTHEINVIG